jgi:hypothetical protein
MERVAAAGGWRLRPREGRRRRLAAGMAIKAKIAAG